MISFATLAAGFATGTTTLTRILGRGNTWSSILANTGLAIVVFMYVFTAASYFRLNIVPLEGRVTDPFLSFDSFILNEFADHVIIAFATILWLSVALQKGKVRSILIIVYASVIAMASFFMMDTLLDIIALASVPLIISLLIYNKMASKDSKILRKNSISQKGYCGTDLFINYLLIIGVATGIAAIIISSSPIFSVRSETIPVHDYAYDIFLIFSRYSPVYIILLINAAAVKVVVDAIKEAVTHKQKSKNAGESERWKDHRMDAEKSSDNGISSSNDSVAFSATRHDVNAREKVSSTHKVIYLGLFMSISIMLTAIPQLPSVNRENLDVGDDTPYYLGFLNELAKSRSPQEFLHNAFTTYGDRPLTLIALFGFVNIMNVNPEDAIEYFPMLLAPALVLVVYFMTRELGSNGYTDGAEAIALIASFLTAVSFQLQFGLLGGLYSNLLALIVGYLCITFLFRFLKAPNKLNLLVYSALLLILLFVHVFTWMMLTLVMTAFLVFLFLNPMRKKILHNHHRNSGVGGSIKRNEIIVLLTIIFGSVGLDIGKSLVTGSSEIE